MKEGDVSWPSVSVSISDEPNRMLWKGHEMHNHSYLTANRRTIDHQSLADSLAAMSWGATM